jgi:FdhD protein
MNVVRSKLTSSSTYYKGRWDKKKTYIIGEQAVTLSVNGEAWLTFMCTPSDLRELAIGFLFNEEIIQDTSEVTSVWVCPNGDNIDVWLNHAVQKPEKWIRTSGCSGGKTSVGKSSLQQISMLRSQNGNMLAAEKIGDLIEALTEVQALYKQSGGVHTSALSDGEKILIVAEDIGRHNTLDKLAGHCLLEQIHPIKKVILTTGRISSEMIQKAARMGAAVVISRTSPSSLSVQMAEKFGVTLIGYARRDRFTVYAHAERILSITLAEKMTSEAA